MGVEKSEIKMAVAHELGAGFDDALEAAERDIYRWDGAKTSLRGAASAIEGLMEHAKRDLDAELLNEESFKLVRKWVQRATEIVRNLRTQAEVHEQRSHGRVEALKTSVKITKKLYDDEQAKLKALQEHVEEEPTGEVTRLGPRRPTGVRPPNVIAAKKAAEAAEKTAEKEEIAPGSAPESEAEERPKKGQRKCGKCGEEGHTARTCKKKKS